jgi:hypothetical protein
MVNASRFTENGGQFMENDGQFMENQGQFMASAGALKLSLTPIPEGTALGSFRRSLDWIQGTAEA